MTARRQLVRLPPALLVKHRRWGIGCDGPPAERPITLAKWSISKVNEVYF